MPDRRRTRAGGRLVELAVGVVTPLLAVGAQIALQPLLGGQAPYAFNFPAVILATVLAGWRSGLLALALGQLLIWLVIVMPGPVVPFSEPQQVAALTTATLSQLLVLAVVFLYQREVGRFAREGERRLRLVEEAGREIDHRIRNNFQTVLALIHLQAQRSPDENVRAALRQIGDRISAIASATEHLTAPGDDLTTICLGDYLGELCSQLERGLLHDGVRLRCEVGDVRVQATDATYLALIVNELVTNAIKHAFHDGRSGEVVVRSHAGDDGFELVVADNGAGVDPGRATAGSGLGQKLVQVFVRELGADYQLASSGTGTSHRIFIPAGDVTLE